MSKLYDVNPNTVAYLQSGSTVYGLSTESSDLDFRAIELPPKKDILLQRSFSQRTVADASTKEEGIIYSLHRFVDQALLNKPNFLELLYTPRRYTLTGSPIWNIFVKNRHLFLHKQNSAILNHCLKIKTSKDFREAALDICIGLKELLTLRPDPFTIAKDALGLTDLVGEDLLGSIKNKLSHYCSEEVLSLLDVTENTLFIKKGENREDWKPVHLLETTGLINIYLNHVIKTLQLKKPSKPKDFKGLSHSARNLLMAEEMLLKGNITLQVSDSRILAIKQGEYSYDKVLGILDELSTRVLEAWEISLLPDHPDTKTIEDILESVYEHQVLVVKL